MAQRPDLEASNLIEAMKRDLAFLVVCLTCDRRIVMEPEVIARRKGPHFTLQRFRAKLKCNRCGSKNIELGLFSKWEVNAVPGPSGPPR